MSVKAPALLERLRRRLRAGDTVTEAARACGVTTDRARGLIVRHGREADGHQKSVANKQVARKAPPKCAAPMATKPPEPPLVLPTLPPYAVPEPGCCAWPEGEGKQIRFECRSPAVPGRPYCLEHCRRAFQHAPGRSDRPMLFARLVSTL